MTITAYSAYGTLLQRGDGGVGAGVKASLTWGATTASIRILAKTAGTFGNSMSVTVVVSGSSFVKTTLTSTVLSITCPTTATVAMVIAWLYQQTNFDTYWDADYNAVGDGTGTITARTVLSLSGGTNGTEAFTTVDGVRSLSGPQLALDTIDVTHHTSASGYRQIIPSFKSAGDVTFDLIYDPADAQHDGLLTDFENRTRRNFQLIFPNTGTMTYSFAGYIGGGEISAPIDNALTLGMKISIDGAVARNP